MKKKETEQEESDKSHERCKKGKWHHYRKKKERIEALEDEENGKVENPPKAVLFVPNTANSVLANKIRETVQSLKLWTALNIKIVERAGDKLQDILCKSNPWDSVDCKRENCFTCEGTTLSGKSNFKNCRQRSVLYENRC